MIRNEMGKKRYIINMIYGNIIFLWIYYITIFSAMKGFSELQSFILLIAAIFMGSGDKEKAENMHVTGEI